MSFSIRPIRPEDMETTKWVIGLVNGEFSPAVESPSSPKKQAAGSLADFNDVKKRYFDQGGVFNVLTDRDRVIGTGALRRLSDSVCELRQLGLLPAYRGRGLGYEMALQLIEWAKDHHYEKMKLEALQNQQDARKLFLKLGFTPIESYQQGPGEVFMELDLVKAHAIY